MNDRMDEVCRLIRQHCRARRQGTALPGLTLFRVDEPIPGVATIYRPTLCLVAQGRKHVVLGRRVFHYDPSKYLIVTVDLPVTGCIVEASLARPYLGLTFDLDPTYIADLLLEQAAGAADPPTSRSALAVGELSDDLLDATVRLLRLLDSPNDIAALAPLIGRELHYRLLKSDQGFLLRQVATAGSHVSQIGRAADWIRSHYATPVSIETLADRCGMSVTSFHRHFKAVTSLSPLQYRTQIRLQEARRRLLIEGLDAGSIGFEVGYESPSQFSRDYRRMFGLPSAADGAKLRREARALDRVAS